MFNLAEYKDLKITNDFMFSKIFSNPKLAKKLVEILLEEEIDEITIIDSQVSISDLEKSKGIKLDILVKIGDSYYNIEMQNENNDDLVKRAVYYRHMLIKHSLGKGYDYKNLPIINIIFICGFDLHKKGLSKYTFTNHCKEDNSVQVNKYGIDMYLSIPKYKNENNLPLKNLLEYFATSKPTDTFTKEIHNALQEVLDAELWKDDYMKFAIEIQNAEVKARAEGEARGEARGEAKGEAKGDMLKSLKLAKKMLNDKDLDYIADFCEIPLVCVQALNDGCSTEAIVEQYCNFDNL